MARRAVVLAALPVGINAVVLRSSAATRTKDEFPECNCNCCDTVERRPDEIVFGAATKCAPSETKPTDVCGEQCKPADDDKVLAPFAQDESLDYQRFCMFECKPAEGILAKPEEQCVALDKVDVTRMVDANGNVKDPAFLYARPRRPAPQSQLRKTAPPPPQQPVLPASYRVASYPQALPTAQMQPMQAYQSLSGLQPVQQLQQQQEPAMPQQIPVQQPQQYEEIPQATMQQMLHPENVPVFQAPVDQPAAPEMQSAPSMQQPMVQQQMVVVDPATMQPQQLQQLPQMQQVMVPRPTPPSSNGSPAQSSTEGLPIPPGWVVVGDAPPPAASSATGAPVASLLAARSRQSQRRHMQAPTVAVDPETANTAAAAGRQMAAAEAAKAQAEAKKTDEQEDVIARTAPGYAGDPYRAITSITDAADKTEAAANVANKFAAKAFEALKEAQSDDWKIALDVAKEHVMHAEDEVRAEEKLRALARPPIVPTPASDASNKWAEAIIGAKQVAEQYATRAREAERVASDPETSKADAEKATQLAKEMWIGSSKAEALIPSYEQARQRAIKEAEAMMKAAQQAAGLAPPGVPAGTAVAPAR